MALAERTEDDAKHLLEVKNYNSNVTRYITDTREENYKLVSETLQRPELNDTLTKLLLVDSRGQHKNQKSSNRLSAKTKELMEAQLVEHNQQTVELETNEILKYNKSKVNLNNYL